MHEGNGFRRKRREISCLRLNHEGTLQDLASSYSLWDSPPFFGISGILFQLFYLFFNLAPSSLTSSLEKEVLMPAFGVHTFCLLLKEYSWIFIPLEFKNTEQFQHAKHCAKWSCVRSLILRILQLCRCYSSIL